MITWGPSVLVTGGPHHRNYRNCHTLEEMGMSVGLEAQDEKVGRVMASTDGVDAAFIAEWNALDKQHRRQVRRLVRIGRAQENADDARLAVGFAAYQRTRGWYRNFWLWFVPLIVAGVIAGLSVHPILLGMVLAAAGNALLVRRAFKRAEWVNEEVLGS